MTDPRRTGPYLRLLRDKLTLREAAAKLGCDFTYLSKVENDRQPPSWELLKKAFLVYEVSDVDQCLFAFWYLSRSQPEAFDLAIRHLSVSSPCPAESKKKKNASGSPKSSRRATTSPKAE